MYRPLFSNARQVRAGWIDERHWVELLDEIEAAALTRYRYLLALHRRDVDEPIMWVSAEESMNLFGAPIGDEAEAEPRFTLGVFAADRHENHGSAATWGDIVAFEARALALVAERLPTL